MICCSTCQKGVRIKQSGGRFTSDFVFALIDGKLHYFCNQACRTQFEAKGGEQA